MLLLITILTTIHNVFLVAIAILITVSADSVVVVKQHVNHVINFVSIRCGRRGLPAAI
jgi:hypothetical protein